MWASEPRRASRRAPGEFNPAIAAPLPDYDASWADTHRSPSPAPPSPCPRPEPRLPPIQRTPTPTRDVATETRPATRPAPSPSPRPASVPRSPGPVAGPPSASPADVRAVSSDEERSLHIQYAAQAYGYQPPYQPSPRRASPRAIPYAAKSPPRGPSPHLSPPRTDAVAAARALTAASTAERIAADAEAKLARHEITLRGVTAELRAARDVVSRLQSDAVDRAAELAEARAELDLARRGRAADREEIARLRIDAQRLRADLDARDEQRLGHMEQDRTARAAVDPAVWDRSASFDAPPAVSAALHDFLHGHDDDLYT